MNRNYFAELAAYEIDLIRAEIPFAGSITELAERLGLNRTTLVMKTRSLGIYSELPRCAGRPRKASQ